MPEAQIGINFEDALISLLDQWNLNAEKQVAITTNSLRLAEVKLLWTYVTTVQLNLNLIFTCM